MKLIEIFKDVVFQIQLNENLKNYIKFSKQLKKVGRTKSNVGGFQSCNLNHDEPTLSNLIKIITFESNNFYKNFLCLKKDIKLDNIWLNINYFKDYNKIHVHPFSEISGVFYVKTPKNCGNLMFHRDTNIDHFLSNDLISKLNQYNSSGYFIPPEENFLYLFPSWLKHSTEPNLSKEERISISFNLS